MVEVLELIFVFVIVPAGLAWVTRKYVFIRSAFVGALVIVVSAAVPASWVFYETQQADGISRAAGVLVTPLFFLFMLLPAGAGYAIAKPRIRS